LWCSALTGRVMTWRGSVQVWWELEVEDRGASAQPSQVGGCCHPMAPWRVTEDVRDKEHVSPPSDHSNDLSDFTTEAFTVITHVS
jgi:hypothetical protein